MADKEATVRIKINKLLEVAGWRFFPEGSAPANIRLEPSVTRKRSKPPLRAFGVKKRMKDELKMTKGKVPTRIYLDT